ncbi:MAG: CsiV family protein [Halioglobus sp.]
MTVTAQCKRHLISLLLLISLPLSALAQEDRWFKIELLIFSHTTGNGANSETWQPDPELDYPEKFRFLFDPDAIANNEAKYDSTSMVSETGVQTFNLTDVDDTSATDIPPLTGEPVQPMPIAPAIESEPSRLPTPFTTLGNSAIEFRGKAAYMERTGGYQTLFHETWVQPVADKPRALPVIIDHSGDQQAWPQLQGSVKFYLSRFLHVETNLWLNTTGNYLKQDWQMPAPPLGPLSVVVNTPEPVALPPVEYELPQDNVEQDTTDIVLETGPRYPWRHAVSLKQTRKMRSTEVHYIDHPMLGVVVLISPITEQELADMAATELAASQSDQASP